jgi:hypothetical protein
MQSFRNLPEKLNPRAMLSQLGSVSEAQKMYGLAILMVVIGLILLLVGQTFDDGDFGLNINEWEYFTVSFSLRLIGLALAFGTLVFAINSSSIKEMLGVFIGMLVALVALVLLVTDEPIFIDLLVELLGAMLTLALVMLILQRLGVRIRALEDTPLQALMVREDEESDHMMHPDQREDRHDLHPAEDA